ncbi:MAG: hypothetical protein IJ370_03235 [Oscillospiraceae bacterium]|nr:hypothetical protein [Oscillospiraceae bacterium]
MKKQSVLKRFATIALSALIVLCSFSACRGSNGGENVYWLLDSSIRNLDPQTASDESELLIIKNCFAPLFEKDQNGEMFSSFVESYGASPDGKRYVFNLYKDKVWSIYQGRKIETYAPLTAHDFKFAIQRLFTDNKNASVMNVLKSIKNADRVLLGEADVSKLSVSCPDDYTLEINLSQPTPSLLEAFTSHELFPCNEEFFKSTSGRYGLGDDLIIFNGSFCLSAWGESSVKLIRNPNCPDPVSVAGVTLFLPKASREAVKLLLSGDIDGAKLSSQKMDTLNSDNFNISERTSVVWTLVLNQNDELWQNANLRSALALCTDRNIFKSGASHLHPADRIVSDSAQLGGEKYSNITSGVSAPAFNAGAAKSAYALALSELEKTKIYNTPVLIVDSPLYKESFSALNQVYQRELSLYFSAEYLSEAAIINRVKSGNFSAALLPLYVTADTPSVSLEYFLSGSQSCIMPIASEDFVNNFTSVQALSLSKESAESYGKAEKALYDSGLVNPRLYESSYFVASKSVSGFVEDSYGTVLFKNVVKK